MRKHSPTHQDYLWRDAGALWSLKKSHSAWIADIFREKIMAVKNSLKSMSPRVNEGNIKIFNIFSDAKKRPETSCEWRILRNQPQIRRDLQK